jgi:hypothetical protein
MRVAVIFFGVARGTAMTVASIKRCIYACNPGATFHTIASLNLVDTITNPRTGELGAPLNAADVFLLNADVYALTRQDDAAIATAFAAARQQHDVFGNCWISVRNHLHQLASLRRAWRLAADLPAGFDYFLFVRPDLRYLDEIHLADLIARFHGDNNISLPAWHSFGGFNDRFALATPGAARHYAGRLDLVAKYCANAPLHPESLLAYALGKGECKIGQLPARAFRVRAHGALNPDDFGLSVTPLPLAPSRFAMEGDQIRFFAE